MSDSTKSHIVTMLKRHDIRIKKKYGQNFLIDDNILRKIVDVSGIDENTLVIEIGPGLGSLTQYLLESSKRVLAYEIDKTFIPILEDYFKDKKSFHLIQDDILKRDIDEDLKPYLEGVKQIVVVANLPYYITTPILMKCLEESKLINRFIVMMQLEVARRLTAHENTKDYNALSVAVQYRTNAKFSFKVPKNVFIPAPNVESAVIKLDVKEETPLNGKQELFFYDFIKQCFKQRRKTILNNLSTAYPIEKNKIVEILNEHNYNPQIRAEALTVDDFMRLSEIFYKLL